MNLVNSVESGYKTKEDNYHCDIVFAIQGRLQHVAVLAPSDSVVMDHFKFVFFLCHFQHRHHETLTLMGGSPVFIRKPQPVPWSHEETVHLIEAYQDKWYELRRGQLKASQWEEVAVTVAARCGYDFSHQAKTATQCRHKMEKLRQRHRSVKSRPFGAGWPFFDLMQRLELGPMPISSRRPDDDEHSEEDRKLQSLEYILRRPAIVNRFSSKRPREVTGGGGGYYGDVVDGGNEMASEIRAFARRLAGVENMRMEMMRETERRRLEMENRRIHMIRRSHQKIADSIHRAFSLSD